MEFHLSSIKNEYNRRIGKNPRYSLRAFASFLGLHPSALSRVLAGKQDLSIKAGLLIAKKLQLEANDCRRFLLSIIRARTRKEVERVGRLTGLFKANGSQEKSAYPHILSSDQTKSAKQDLHDDILQRALASLRDGSPELCAHYGMTLSIDVSQLDLARQRIREFLESLSDELEGGELARAYQVGVQLFPLTRD